jgi:predicted DNA-binding WGR domain protein
MASTISFSSASNASRRTFGPTLFDESSLVREWERIGKLGRRRIELYRDDGNARIALSAWLARKVRRGYKTRPPADST